MLEFKKLCDAYENLSASERILLLTEKSVKIMAKLQTIRIFGVDPASVLAGFIICSVTADGKINEKEYLIIYPALVRIFGADFDFASVKEAFCHNKTEIKMLTDYTENMLRILDFLDDELKQDVITLCLCVTSIDEKISLKEKKYIKHLCDIYSNQ